MHPFAIDWQTAFLPTVPTAEIILRGTIVYLAIFGMMRFVLKREGGNVGLADLLMTVLVADAAQNAMAAEYKSVTDGLILVGTIVFWNYALDWLTFTFPGFAEFWNRTRLSLSRTAGCFGEICAVNSFQRKNCLVMYGKLVLTTFRKSSPHLWKGRKNKRYKEVLRYGRTKRIYRFSRGAVLSPGPNYVAGMFGGHCLYCDGVVFALVASNSLYLKADDGNRARFVDRRLKPFKPFPDRDEVMSYYEAPAEIFEDSKAMRDWVGSSVAAGRRKGASKKRPRK